MILDMSSVQKRSNALSSESKTYSWQETKDIITGKKKIPWVIVQAEAIPDIQEATEW